MLRSMLHSKVQHEHQLDWGNLVTGRDAQVVRRRWRTMLKVTAIIHALVRSLEFQPLATCLCLAAGGQGRFRL